MAVGSKVASVFDHWAVTGRGQRMAEGHFHAARHGFGKLGLVEGQRFLDIGCGLGYSVGWAADVAPSVVAKGVDLSPKMIDGARKACVNRPNTHFLSGLFPDVVSGERFSRIFSVEALYYFADVETALHDVFNALEPNGRFVTVIDHYLENPACHQWHELVGVPLVLWSVGDWCEAMKRVGFRAVKAERFKHPRTSETSEWQIVHGSLILSGERL